MVQRIPELGSAMHGQNWQAVVLIVEDEPLMLRLLKGVLSQHGFGVLTAADGEEAVEVYRRQKGEIDVVLLDIGLPKISGWEVLHKMRDENPDARIVIASGYLEPEVMTGTSGAGIEHVVSKPYALNEVAEIIRNLIETK